LSTRPWGDIGYWNVGAQTSLEVSGIPLNGQAVHVRLWWKTGSVWKSADYAFTTVNQGGELPTIVTPVSGSELSSNVVTFEWNAGDGVSEYALGVGTTAQSLSNRPWGNIGYWNVGTATSKEVSGIPLTGESIYVRLWWKSNGMWHSEDYTFGTVNIPGTVPEMISPNPTSLLDSVVVNFEWSPGDGVEEYFLGVATDASLLGKAPWGDIYAQTNWALTSADVIGIPINGNAVHVRLWWRAGGEWKHQDYVYSTATAL